MVGGILSMHTKMSCLDLTKQGLIPYEKGVRLAPAAQPTEDTESSSRATDGSGMGTLA